MDLDQYREAVRTVACPHCGAGTDEPCARTIDCLSIHHGLPTPHEHAEPVDYVHDDRSLAWEQARWERVQEAIAKWRMGMAGVSFEDDDSS